MITNNNNFFDSKKEKISQLKQLETAISYRSNQNRESCNMCGNTANLGENLNQLWIEDLPLARACNECVSMIQRLVINTRRERERKTK